MSMVFQTIGVRYYWAAASFVDSIAFFPLAVPGGLLPKNLGKRAVLAGKKARVGRATHTHTQTRLVTHGFLLTRANGSEAGFTWPKTRLRKHALVQAVVRFAA